MNIHSRSFGTVGLPSVHVPSVSRCDQEAEKPYKLWSDTPGEPHDLTKHVQELLRKIPDNPNREGLTNQQSSVSNKLEEKELWDSHQENWDTLAWGPYPEILAEKILEDLESKSKIQNNSTSFLNCEEFPNVAVMEKDFKDQFPQQLCGPNTRRQWLCGDNFSEYVLQPKSANVSLSNPRSHTNKNSHTELNVSMCQNGLSQMERHICSQMQKQNIGMEMPPSIRGLPQMTPPTVKQMKKAERRQSPQIDHHSDLLGSNLMMSANAHHYMSHATYESWRYPMLHTKSKITQNHRSTWPHHAQVEFTNGILRNYPGETSSRDDQSKDDQCTYADQLSHYLHECGVQCRSLEEERQTVEAFLDNTFGKPLKRATDTQYPPNPLNDSEIYQLMATHLGEQAQVARLVERMHSMCSHPQYRKIHSTLNHHQTTICITQARIRDALGNKQANLHQVTYTDDKVTLLLMISMKDLAGTTRKLRTALWCALQMTLAELSEVLDDHDSREKADTESMSEGYFFNV
ncbi:uncharacterized protein moto [Synchiropus picturatus]